MKKYETESIRNLGMFSHGGEGKTTTVEAMLFLAGKNTRLGKVDEGTSLMDYEPEEIERKATISASIACFEWNKYKINLIDTPGDDNFIYDAKLCMRVVDGAVILVSAVSGVRVQTEKVWEYANEFGVPTCFVINKIDRERADFSRTLEDLQKNFTDKSIVAVQLPMGDEDAFRGVVEGTIFSSSLFPNRAPAGHLTLTSYVGGERFPELASLPPDKLFALTCEDLRVLLGVKGKPTFQHSVFYPRAIPQYNVGYGRYRELMAEIEGKAPGLFFAGHFRDGISLSDTIVSACNVADRAGEFLGSAPVGQPATPVPA